MAAGVEMTETEKVTGVCLNIPANDAALSLSPSRVPRRLRRRLSESKSPSTVEEIETKLKEADLRRQQFHELLSKKAQAKTRNLIWRSSQEEDLSQRLEAKLSAAKQKRLNILVKSRMRLARLDKLRQLAKFGVQSRHEKERTELGMKVESRIQKAEGNRMRLLKAYKQRRAAKKERAAQSLMRRMIQDRKYKESLKDNLEDRLQRAKRQRAEYLRQEGSPSRVHANSVTMHKRGEILSRRLARCWRRFKISTGTTLALAKAYEALGINITAIRSMPFDHLAMLIESPSTIQATKVLLDRLETRFTLSNTNVEKNGLSSSTDITHLLKQVVSPNRKGNATNVKVSRYPVRVVLCAYMILGHPDAVFIQKGERETALVESASDFIRQFELLIKIIMDGPVWFTNDEKAASSMPNRPTCRSQLEVFDKSWCSYLYCFVAWKVKDAKLLEEDLVRAACQLEVSRVRASNLATKGDNDGLTYKLDSIQKQVSEEQKLLRDQVKHLCGNAGLERMDHALTELCAKFLNSNSSIALRTVLHDETSYLAESYQSSSNVVPSLFGKKDSTSPIRSSIEHQGISGIENELIVNEIVHEHHCSFADRLDVSGEDQNSIKAKVRETMEKAFWDGIMESVEQDEPDYSWVLKLMKEIRDELCEMSPSSWRQEIVHTIDIVTLSEVLRSGISDIDYLGRVLEFALVTLQKLSAPANDDEMKNTCQNLLKELGDMSRDKDKSNTSFTLLLIKGLRFVLRQIQILKRDISKARVKILEPLIKGPAGVEYLKKAFSSHYGPPNEALNSLPLTMKWISSNSADSEHEWKEYTDSSSALGIESFSHGIPPTTLKTGGRFPLASISSSGNEQPECRGEKVDLLIRLGLVKLVHEIGELTEETLPETLKLNLFRLRAVQSQVQKIIVISISMLVLRQTLLTDKLVTNPMDMESVVSKCIKGLSQLLDRVEDAGTPDIIETINSECTDHLLGPEKLHARKEVMANMLAKSLRAGDAIFTKVSHAVYVAMRGVVFGGSGVKGMQLAELALKRVGAASLAGKVQEAAEVLVVVAVVSGAVHRPWYEQLLKESV